MTPRLSPEQLGALTSKPSMLAIAVAHAANGWQVFPLRPNGKEPLTRHGFKDATRDPEQIRRWWKRHPTANIGGATGESRVVVADLDVKPDPRTGEPQHGPENWAVLVADAEHEPGFSCTTPTGGLHLVWRDDEGVPSSNGQVAEGVDIKSVGGYIVLPGSVTDDGIYRTTMGEPLPRIEELPLASEGLRAVARSRKASKPEASRGTALPRRSLSELLADPPTRGAGQLNDWLSRVAGHLARKHRGDRASYEVAVREAAALVDPDYEDTEKVLESVWTGDRSRHPSGVPPVALDDSSLVDAMVSAFTGRWCWSGAHGWREWDGKVWASRTDAALTEQVRLSLQELYQREAAATTDSKRAAALGQLLSGSKVRGVAGLLRGALEVDSTAFDSHADLLNCNNGVVDLRTSELHPHDPRLLMTKVTTVDFQPGVHHLDWDTTLEAVPEDVRSWFQVRIGQAATGYRVTDELMPVLYGGGRNGKTTFLSSIQAALGSHGRAVSDRVLTARDTDHPTELTDLQGLRLAVIEELPEAIPLSVKRLKDTVGQPTITARKIAKDTVTWETSHALLLATNHKPRVNETDHGTWRRLALVRFPFVFDGGEGIGHRLGDPGLHDRMRRGGNGRLEAVLAWIIEGARRWYDAGQVFPAIPERVARDTEEWRGESDVIVSYIADRLRFDPHAAVGTTELLLDLNTWLDAHGKAAWGDQLLTERFGTHERVTVHGVDKRKGRLAASGVQVMGRDGRALAKQPEQARLWWGVAFQASGPSSEEVPW